MDDAMNYPIPDAALDDRLAFLGTSGAGKTYAAGTAVERLLGRMKARVVIVDPLDVWWGLRLKQDGSRAGFPVVIFGGAHADLPITEAAGALIGETVATMAESCVVSLGGFPTKAAERRFMLAFLERLYRKATGEPFHLVFDEADLFAPQKTSEPQLQNLMEQIVRRGRVKGFIPWLITQRPAVLSKDVLSQADGLIAMKLTSSQDRDAIHGWIEGQADRKDEKRMLARLPQLARGEAVIWIPGRGLLQEAKFPAKETFDSSRTPKRGETVRRASLKPVDLDAVKARLAQVQSEVAKPKAAGGKTAAAPAVTVTVPDPRALRQAEDAGRRVGFDDGKRVGFSEGYKTALREAQLAVAAVKTPEPTLTPMPQRPPVPAGVTIPARPAPRAPRAQAVADADDKPLAKAERLILTALAQYPQGRTKVQIAVLTGYAVGGGGFNNALGSLRSRGYVVGQGVTELIATGEGISALGEFQPLPSGPDLLDHWMRQLGKAERLILATLTAVYPATLSKEEVAEGAGYEASGGGFNNALGRLRTLELINGGGAALKASDDLFLSSAA
jgi:hypothetical protein